MSGGLPLRSSIEPLSYSHLYLAALEMQVDAVFAGVTSVTSGNFPAYGDKASLQRINYPAGMRAEGRWHES
jgi:hypothetical protein